MGDSRRFDVFSSKIASIYPPSKYKSVADVAGGKGMLQVALRKIGYNVTTYDKRHDHIKSNKIQYKYRYFDESIKEKYDLLVGMHPDEATDIIISEAMKRHIPFCVVPCCILPTVTKYKGNSSRSDMGAYRSWVNHLQQYAERGGYTVSKYDLPIDGKNIALFGSPQGYRK